MVNSDIRIVKETNKKPQTACVNKQITRNQKKSEKLPFGLYYLQVVRTEVGNCLETMYRKSWDVQEFIGQHACVRLIDDSSSGWGHINFDDLKGDTICDNGKE